MKTFIFSIFVTIVVSFSLNSCNNEDEQGKTLRQTYIDISDFTMYKGSATGGVKIEFNNLKKKKLVEQYLSEVFAPDAYQNITFRFNGNKLTYLESISGGNGKQIISDYRISKDSLLITSSDPAKKTKFIALIDANNNYYKRIGLVSYTNPNFTDEESTEPRMIQDSVTTIVNMQTVLQKLGYSSINELTNPTDTIIWCNVIYPFN